MIYTVSEIAATAIDSIILVLYPAITFLYKSGNKLRNITVTILFMALFFVSTSVSLIELSKKSIKKIIIRISIKPAVIPISVFLGIFGATGFR